MFQHTLIQSVQTPSGQLNAGNKVYQGAANIEFDEQIGPTTVDVLVNINLIVANLKSVVLTSDKDVLLETNDGTTPGNTINLKANVPYIWTTDSYDTNKLTVNVTKLYYSNAGAVLANVSGRFLYDPTP